MKRPMFWILLGSALLSLPLSGCYTRLGYSGNDPDDYGYYDEYSDRYDWIDGYYTVLPYSWYPAYDRGWWYSDYHQSYWYDGPYDYETYDQVSDQNGWPRGGRRGDARTPRGGVVGGGGGGGVTVETPSPATQSRNPARQGSARATTSSPQKSPTKAKSRDKKRPGWGR